MEKKQKKRVTKKALCILLSFALCLSGMVIMPGGNEEVKAASNVISIASADDLAKIGTDDNYPMNGDYVLTTDIDLSGVGNWTPIGGASGPEYGLDSGEHVFSGTFDGAGHMIEGLTIQYDGKGSSDFANTSGLFAMIGSDLASDYAEVKNICFSEVSITHTLGRADMIGTLTGDVNGYAKVDNIAVLSGNIHVKSNGGGDLIGVGGIVGQTRKNSAAVHMTNLYNAASITVDSAVPTYPERCGGILGRIHQQGKIGSLTACVNVGEVTYKGVAGYGINGTSDSINAAANTENISNCYYISGQAKDFGASVAVTQAELASEAMVKALGEENWAIYNGRLLPVISEGKVIVPIPSPEFAQGDSAALVTKDFTLPRSFISEEGEEEIFWTSGDTSVISIDNEGGIATVSKVLSDTVVKLTAVTSVSKRTKTVEVTVRSNLKISVDKEYAKPGVQMTASVENAPEDTVFSYVWKVVWKSGKAQQSKTVSQEAFYTPDPSDINRFITVTAFLNGSFVGEKRIYCSRLPVVYIDTNDGANITDKENYKGATMRVQGNDTFNSTTTTLYEGGISIRGRGNSTWNPGYSKLPYKLKLDTKTDMFGFGASKHWVLLANYLDESLLRNSTSYDLAGRMGITPYLPSTHVELILNGDYAGNYQFVGNVRVDKSRVNIYNWEDLAEDVAKAIGKKEGITGDARDALEDYLNEHMQWITSDSVTYGGKTYKISDYFTDIPKNADGSINTSGGFLFELDEYFDEYSKFYTSKGLPMMFKSPEFVRTNTELFQSAQNYIQAVENSVWASDFYTTYNGERKHYTELVDIDSLVNYLILNEFYWNTETMKKSTYMYKDLDSKLVIGPLWDMDWSSNSRISESETNYPTEWMTIRRGNFTSIQGNSWYLALYKDPYFVQKMYECYVKNRQNFEDIVKNGGVIDQNIEYLRESGKANYEAGFLQAKVPFESEAERLRTFLKARLEWMDQQFVSLDTLLGSLGKYSASGRISVTADTEGKLSTVYTVSVTDTSAKKVGFYINGILAGSAEVSGQKAVLTVSDDYLDKTKDAVNIVQVRAMDASGALLSGGSINNYATFTKEVAVEQLTGAVTIGGQAKVGSVLRAIVTDSNFTGTLFYQWKADGEAIAGANAESYQLTDAEEGKQITVEVTCSVESGSLLSAATEPVVKAVVENDHIIINQVYGGGANNETPVSHSFIELHNPTDTEISIKGYTLGYLSGGKNGAASEEVKLSLNDTVIPAHASYLIRCEAQDDTTPNLITLRVDVFDQEWTQSIDNKRYRLILYDKDKITDGVSVNEGDVEGAALADGTVSKQKAIRRKAFADTDNNTADFEVIEYKGADAAKVEINRPRSLADGSWAAGGNTPDPGPKELSGTVAIRGNAILGAILYADEVTNNTGELFYQWKADGSDIAGETGQFYEADDSCIGKRISVTVTSSVETGSLEVSMEENIKAVEAQNDHLIIHQVYGGGGKGGTPISHSFIELYNPTPRAVSLTDYRIEYLSNGKSESLELSGTVPCGTSYLIQCAAEENSGSVLTISDSDCTWDLSIANKRYSVILKKGADQVDGVSVNEEPVEGTALVNPPDDEIISKNKAVRRISFVDTDDNAMDFEVLNYSKLPKPLLAKVVPRSSADGAWGLEIEPEPEPEKPDAELVKKLQDKVQEAEKIDGSRYTEETYAELESELSEARKKLASEAVTTEELQEALANLQQAIDGLREKEPEEPEKPDAELVKKLQDKVQEAEKIDGSKYTEETYAELESELSEARKKLTSEAVTTEELQEALTNLQQAIDGLLEKEPEEPEKPDAELVKKLWDKVQEAEQIDGSKYTEETYAKLEGELSEARKKLTSEAVTKQEIQEALTNLQQALDGLKEKVINPPIEPEKPDDNPVVQDPIKELPKTGSKFRVGKAWYKVTKSSASGCTAVYWKPAAKTYRKVVIPANVKWNNITFKVTSVSAQAFKNNKKLTSVTIGKNVTSIGSSAFAGCKKLKEITIQSKVLNKVGKNALKEIHSKCKIKVPNGMMKKYKIKFKKKGQKSGVQVVK